MKKVYGMTGIVAAAVLAVSCLLPSVPVSAEETGMQALAEAVGSGMVQQGMVLGAVGGGGGARGGAEM